MTAKEEPSAPKPEEHATAPSGADAAKFRMSLLENAYDSMNESLSNADLADEHDLAWKWAILHITHAIELLMKERLRRAHPLLVYSNVDKPTHTVSVEVALNRLQSVGVAVDPADIRAIQKTIEWRNKITHYEFEMYLSEIQSTYALLFEFLHTFHEKELGESLHNHINKGSQWKAAKLIEQFRQDFVTFNGVPVIKKWPRLMHEAQLEPMLQILGQNYKRVRYGSEPDWRESDMTPRSNCHDCAVLIGQVHVESCSMERCPRCNGQLFICDCEYLFPLEANFQELMAFDIITEEESE